MSDLSSPLSSTAPPDKRSFIRKLIEYLIPGPDSHAELYNTLSQAEDNQLIGPDSRVMLEGVLRIADMTADDAMVPVPRMNLIDINWSYEQILKEILKTAHSRFPVYEEKKENIEKDIFFIKYKNSYFIT